MIDIVCFYAHLGRPYGELMARMTASAKSMFPCRTVLLTPTPSADLTRFFDETVELSHPANPQTVCLEKVRAIVSWAVIAERPTLFADPDLVFTGTPPLDNSFDVGLLWRKTKPDQPINTGAILVNPGPKLRDFWLHYGRIASNMPAVLHPWFCDQMAFALMTGDIHQPDERLTIDGARVWLMNATDHCYKPGTVSSKAWALHMKGATKGPGWDQVFTNQKALMSNALRSSHTDGMLLAASASSKATATVPN